MLKQDIKQDIPESTTAWPCASVATLGVRLRLLDVPGRRSRVTPSSQVVLTFISCWELLAVTRVLTGVEQAQASVRRAY